MSLAEELHKIRISAIPGTTLGVSAIGGKKHVAKRAHTQPKSDTTPKRRGVPLHYASVGFVLLLLLFVLRAEAISALPLS